MPMALVIQSSEPTEGSKMPQGLVISESKKKSRVCRQYGLISKTLILLLTAQTSPSSASCRVSASGSGVRRRLCSAHRVYMQSCRTGKVCSKVSVW